jgi:hypothetical protein
MEQTLSHVKVSKDVPNCILLVKLAVAYKLVIARVNKSFKGNKKKKKSSKFILYN